MPGYDIIGDVHGSATMLVELLRNLGYDDRDGAYAHPERTAVFVGDLIDRGTEQRRTLEIVTAMAQAGTALVTMGNHEFNAIAYATEDPDGGGHLRPHNKKNDDQHRAFLDQLNPEEQRRAVEWFLTLPLWLDLGDLRVVHACWHHASIDVLSAELGGDTFPDVTMFARAARKPKNGEKTGDAALYWALENVLKGPELPLSDLGLSPFYDKDGHGREAARVCWWREHPTTVSELIDIPPGSLGEDGKLHEALAGPLLLVDVLKGDPPDYTYTDPIPVVYGHYWRNGIPHRHEDWTTTTACVDFSAVKGGTLVAYRWDGEAQIDPTHYHPHGPDLVAPTPSD
jgi:hypothetical protein